ncbi:MAG: fibronectin-binding domain-containing protein [Promethearchaeota archaeon]|nr:MAG: fibronectin-binding domain-containing protein [Candidatus Lokiarchaeota archaeon]
MTEKYSTFSNFDVFTITKELDIILSQGKIDNIYEVEDLLILKISTKQGRRNLIIKSDSRVNITNFDYPIPKYPSQYIISIRKLLKNRRIISISQHNLDRIVIIELSDIEGASWRLIIELFNKGNFFLIDDQNIIKVAKRYKKFKDRNLLPGKEYQFPQTRGENFLTLNQTDFRNLVKSSDSEIVRILARNINISGLYSEEICFRAHIEKDSQGKNLKDAELDQLFKSVKDLRNQLLFGEIKAHIIIDDEDEEIAVLPFELEIFQQSQKRYYNSFNEAVDEYYSKRDSDRIIAPQDLKINEQIKAQKKILKNQLEYLEDLKIKKKKHYMCGDLIYSNFKPLENLLNVILEAKSKGYSWDQINDKLIQAKQENLEGSQFFKKIISSTKQLIILINNNEINLDLNKSLGENANLIYSKGKKAGKKIKGTLPAIEKSKEKIEELNLKKDSMEMQIDFLIKKPKKKWYEKFRWFKSSDGFIIIAGRDATSNEVIFKKYLESNDLVFHTDFSGSPLAVVKNQKNKMIPETTIKETAEFTASFSRAWKEIWGVVDVFYVNSDQVSKSPPTGEFLPKGSFMITGKKNFIRNAKTQIAVGLELIKLKTNSQEVDEYFYPKILCGPENAIKMSTEENYVLIKPSKSGLSSGKLAKELKQFFINNVEDEKKKYVKLLSLDDIIINLPPGQSIILNKS